jgi:hypothetical protein
MSGVGLEAMGDPIARDFRRANGAPMVVRLDDPTKWDRYSRPSGWGNDLDDESNLVLWKIDRAMEGVACDPSIGAMVVASLGKKEGAKERRERAIQRGRGEEAADMGTALHAMTERVERGDGFCAPPPFDADIAAYLTTLDSAGLVSKFIECKLCNDEWRAAGTADRIYQATREIPVPGGPPVLPGQMVLGDLKTGKRLDYSLPGYCIQLALYVDSVFYDVETNKRTPLPPELRTDVGLLVHMPAGTGTCSFHWTDLQVGREGCRIVRDVRAWRKRKDFIIDFTPPPSDEVAVLATPMEVVMLGSFVPHEPDIPDEVNVDAWIEAMSEFAQSRINTIGTSNEARALLLRRWPPDTPTLRQGGITAAQLSAVLDLLDAIEGAFSLPFPPGDPRVEWGRGLHRGQTTPTNNQPQEPRSPVP